MNLIFYIIIFCLIFIKKVPPRTLMIIDRNGHYLKTKRYGFYFKLPSDKITTTISENALTRTLTDFYETDDGEYVSATIRCRYKTDNLDNVEYSLATVRRSIDDVIKSAAYFAIGNYTFRQITKLNPTEFIERFNDNLKNELNSLGVNVLTSNIYVQSSLYTNVSCFKPHVSNTCGGGSASTPHNDETAIHVKDNYKNGPIIY